MNQKRINIKSEIILQLIKGKTHGRDLSKKINLPLTTIQRTLFSLNNENVIDYNTIGKNKEYFLKNSISARKYIFDAENYKLLKLIHVYPYLESLIKRLLSVDATLIILFGSYAKFTAEKKSDIDIYIETKNPKLKKELEDFNSKFSVKIGTFNVEDLLIKEIIKNHIIIKGLDNFYEKSDFFK